MSEAFRPRRWNALTREIDDTSSPVRRFLEDRFAAGLRDVQRRYREGAPSLAVPAAERGSANPGTIGTAADWLLRLLVSPQPPLDVAMAGTALALQAGLDLRAAVVEMARSLGLTLARQPTPHGATFAGPLAGNTAPPELLARAAWALALLTEVYRAGPMALAAGPLGQVPVGSVTADDLLGLAPSAGLDQLARFRQVFETALLPRLATRQGPWAIGPVFTGSTVMNADADLIAAGLLLDLKTAAARPSLGVKDMCQLIGYALLDFDDEYQITDVGLFAARYGYLATWELGSLLPELAGHPVSLSFERAEFRGLLTGAVA
jgi:hypothetical protein